MRFFKPDLELDELYETDKLSPDEVDIELERRAQRHEAREKAREKARELRSQGHSLIQIRNHLIDMGFEGYLVSYFGIEEWCEGIELDPSIAACEASQEGHCEQYEQYKAAQEKARKLYLQGASFAVLSFFFREAGLPHCFTSAWFKSVDYDFAQDKTLRTTPIYFSAQRHALSLEAQEKARELRSQGLSFDFIQAFLTEHEYKTGRGTAPSLSALSAWCRGIKADRKLSQEKALERDKAAQEKARKLYSQGLSFKFIREVLYDLNLSTAEGTTPTLETLSVWCRDVEVDTLSPSPSEVDTLSSSPSLSNPPPPDTTAQEKARELRSQGLSLSLIRDSLKELGLKTSRGTHPTLKTLFVWCRDIEVKELKRKQSPHKGGRQRLEDMPQYEGLVPLIKRERAKGTSFNQIAALVAERGYKTAGEKAINKTQLIRIWKRISDD